MKVTSVYYTWKNLLDNFICQNVKKKFISIKNNFFQIYELF